MAKILYLYAEVMGYTVSTLFAGSNGADPLCLMMMENNTVSNSRIANVKFYQRLNIVMKAH